MISTTDVFCEIPCLTEKSALLNGVVLQKKWFKSADKRIIGQYLQKFIHYNTSLFEFIGVQPSIEGSDQNVSLAFRTSEFIGAIPLRSPDTGKQIGDFVVTPRFSGKSRFADYIEILNILEKEINPETKESLPLVSGNIFRPPFYLEALKFIETLEALVKVSWRKFDVAEEVSNQPVGKVNWNKYVNESYKVEKRLKFPTRRNVLSEFHPEYSVIRYVFDVCKTELLSSNTPIKLKTSLRPRIQFLEEKLYFHQPKFAPNLKINSFDNPIVSACKKKANRILNQKFIDSTAWRIDFSDVFEKFVQHIFMQTAKETGGKLFPNYKFRSNSSKHFSWELKHIEPDAIFQKEDLLVFIDAKYKSNLYNKFSISEKLKEDHRQDLHQIMAYSSFSKSPDKFSFLCYPSSELGIKKTSYKSDINQATITIFLFGIPLKKDSIPAAKKILMDCFDKIEEKKLV